MDWTTKCIAESFEIEVLKICKVKKQHQITQ